MDINATVRTAQESDRRKIETFLDHAAAIHRHLDWRSPFDWLGNQNFLISQDDRQINGLLICTAEPNETHWVRVFGSMDFTSMDVLWQRLFNAFLEQSHSVVKPLVVASIAYFDWMKELLAQNQWKIHQRVVQLKWNETNLKMLEKKWPEDLLVRPMSFNDLEVVTRIDQECFPFIWTQSQDVIGRAFDQSSYNTVAMLHGKLVGFQISTSFKAVAHLARLAVSPLFQGQYIGQALVQNMLRHFSKPWIREITVNTQHDNEISLKLYKKMGFSPTGENYPIFIYRKD